ncbi:hypothetical protein LCGC14_0900710 [marine sediment metagenome]|uniref:Uncharacterized protein n=1 Tax=marine sediment metagenome TaxID=412755 RepID=A0A0F9RFM8_9ZZZZ
MTGNNNFEKEILRLIYSKFDTIKSFTLPFNELKQDSFFLNESILEINFELKKLTDKGFLNVLESKPETFWVFV